MCVVPPSPANMLRWLEDGARPASVVPNEALFASLAEWQQRMQRSAAASAAATTAAAAAAAAGEEEEVDPKEVFKTCMQQARLGEFVTVRRVVGEWFVKFVTV